MSSYRPEDRHACLETINSISELLSALIIFLCNANYDVCFENVVE